MEQFNDTKIVHAVVMSSSKLLRKNICNCGKHFESCRAYSKQKKTTKTKVEIIHAELSALITYEKLFLSGKYNKNKVDIFVYRVNSNGDFLMAKPCKNCVKKMYESKIIKIKNIYYTNEMGGITRIHINDLINDETLVTHQH